MALWQDAHFPEPTYLACAPANEGTRITAKRRSSQFSFTIPLIRFYLLSLCLRSFDKRLHFKKRLVGLSPCLLSCHIFPPFGVASIARIWDDVFWVFLKHLQTHPGFDDPKVMV